MLVRCIEGSELGSNSAKPELELYKPSGLIAYIDNYYKLFIINFIIIFNKVILF